MLRLKKEKKSKKTNGQWSSMVYTLIDRDIRHHTGQNVVDLRGAVNQIATLLPLRKSVKLLNNPREKVEEIINHCSLSLRQLIVLV